MMISEQCSIPAPIDWVEFALRTIDEYPAWEAATVSMAGVVGWNVGSRSGRERTYAVRCERAGTATAISIGHRATSLRLTAECRRAARARTDVRIEMHYGIQLALLSGRAILAADLHEFCASLALRARWLDRAPDTSFANHFNALPHDPAHPVRSASLEQLHGRFRELEGGIFVLDSGGACCLIDIEQHRFLRAPADADFSRLVQFARWHPFEDVLLDGDDIVIVPLAGAAALRFQPIAPAAAVEPVGTTRARVSA